MTQTYIRMKLVRFLELYSHDYLADLDRQKKPLSNPFDIARIEKFKQEHLDYLAKLKKKLTKGFCFGFSLCHGAMELSGKLRWWENALVEVALWDGTREALEQEVRLPLADQVPLPGKMKLAPQAKKLERPRQGTLRNLMQRVLDYIVFNHADVHHSYHSFLPEGMTQPKMLQSAKPRKKGYFELLDGDKIKTVKHRKKFAGLFTKGDLDNLLDENTISNAICLVHSIDHTIHLSYNGKQWMLYDPNYDHSNLTSIHFSGTKQQVVDQIFVRLGNGSKSIEVATFDEKKKIKFPRYKKLLQEAPERLLSGEGLCMMARDVPRRLMEVLTQIDKNPVQGRAIRAAIADAIPKFYDHNWTGLHFASLAPDCLIEICKLADANIRTSIIKSLALANKKGWTSLALVQNNAPEAMVEIFKLATTPIEKGILRSAISVSLRSTIREDCKAFHIFASRGQQNYIEICRLADNSTEGIKIQMAIAESLGEQNKEGKTGLYMVARYSPFGVLATIKFALAHLPRKQALELIIRSLALSEEYGKTIWEMYVPSMQKPEVFSLLLQHVERMDKADLIYIERLLASSLPINKVNYNVITFFNANKTINLGVELLDKTRSVLRERERAIMPSMARGRG